MGRHIEVVKMEVIIWWLWTGSIYVVAMVWRLCRVSLEDIERWSGGGCGDVV